jgi:hypothetical protein
MTTGFSGRIQLATRDDLDAVGRLLPDLAGPLFQQRFPGQTVADFCCWKYFTNPVGDAAVGIAMEGQRVISLVAGMPKRVQIGSEVVLAFELGDFITAPEYRKRGLFSKLINMVCEESLRRGATFAYVRPNDSSFPILTTGLSFSEVQRIDERRYVTPSSVIHRKLRVAPTVLRALGLDWLALRRVLPSAMNSVTVKQVARFGQEMDELWKRSCRQYSFALVRDSSYLNWRYADCPTPFQLWVAYRGGDAAGYVTVFIQQSEPVGYIVDLFTDAEDAPAAAALLRSAMEAMFAKGVQRIYAWTPQIGALPASARALKRACPLVATPHLHVAMRFLDPQINASRFSEAPWQLTLGDFDGL